MSANNMEDLKKLLESMMGTGSNVNVGPGLSGFMGFSSTNEMKKYADDMKEMLSKDVEELAAKEGGGESVTTLDVRGRKMVIPQAGPRRQNAILFACLYAVGSPQVDTILRTLDAKAYFMANDGGVTLAKLVLDEPKAQPAKELVDPGKLGGRNILIGDGEAPKTCLVALRRVDTGVHFKIGIPVGQSEDGGVTVKLAHGKTVDVPADFVTWISDEAELLKIMTEIAQAKQ